MLIQDKRAAISRGVWVPSDYLGITQGLLARMVADAALASADACSLMPYHP